ncbi:MAG: hypothetical protein WED15_09455 [Akkermansiaceae bacterium]
MPPFLLALILGTSTGVAAVAPRAVGIPVTSYQVDVADDPENAYSGAPRFDWQFFGNQTRIITKSPSNYLNHRNKLGINYQFYFLESKSFTYPPSATINSVIQAAPEIPVIQFANIGKINRKSEDPEKAVAHDPKKIRDFKSHYPNLILGGGQTAEVDGDFEWLYSQYYGRLPQGPGGRVFPAAYQDFIESNLKRSGAPYMLQQHNQAWGTHYAAKERAMCLSTPQLFYRRTASIVDSLVTSRSASRQYPHPFGVQFSGQPILEVSNSTRVRNNGAIPIYKMGVSNFGPNYGKSYALNRQMLYLSWLNGARFFNWEGREFITSLTPDFPSPLGTFTKKAADFMDRFGPVGPVQSPIALISEFSNAWRPPGIQSNKTIDFNITGDAPYAKGDYQLHGLRDFFYPQYLQCESIYKASMREDFALSPTPYGHSIDFLLSDARHVALDRYGLLIWGGVPPEAPSMVREKLFKYINAGKGRVVLFGAAARSMFPDWFQDRPPTCVNAGTTVSYAGISITETSDFLLENLRAELNTSELSMKVLATVDGKPLVVECLGGLVLVLSDYGTNHTESVSSTSARWKEDQLVTEIPHQLLDHVRRLLNEEASKNSLFSVGNKQLHFVTTRPQDGEYLVGIFNDKLTSEPFSITSNIGKIISLEEVPLNDSKQQLKEAAGGAAYAPPGLRNSTRLPLDYGLSNASHIEGRDFRLFRVKLLESGVRPISTFQFPGRPVGRVLAVSGLESIRSYLQGIPSFFQWFDGIKVDASDLLAIEDSRLADQAHWLNRRGVRLVIDGVGIDEPTALRVLTKLALVDTGLKDLITGPPSDAILSAAALSGVTLQNPTSVNRVGKMGQSFSQSARLNILDLHYKTEEDVFADLQHFLSGKVVTELHGKPHAKDLCPRLAVTRDVSKDFIYVGPNVHSLTELLEQSESELTKFRGVKVDSTYLLSKTKIELTKDAAKLTQMGLEIVVDLRKDQMHHDGITFYPHIPNYNSGMLLYNEIIGKMQTLGAHDLMIRLQDVGGMRNNPKYIAQRDATWNTFAEQAQTRSIRLHLIFDPRLEFSSVSGLSRSNVFVIEGSKGNPSPFKLLHQSETTGKGKVTIHDAEGGLHSSEFDTSLQSN